MHDGGRNCTHARGEAQSAVSAFKRGDLALGDIGGGIAYAGVGVAVGFDAVDVSGIDKQGILENRRYDCAAEFGVLVAQMGADIFGGGVFFVLLSQKSHEEASLFN
jgi:hypothetical protein